MTVRAIDPKTGDIVTSGEQFLYERDDVTQTIGTRLRLFYGENFRNIQDGTPWRQAIFPKSTSLQTKNIYLRERIAETPNVLRLLKYQSNYDIGTRKYTISAEVLTTFGQITIEQEQGLTPLTTQEIIGG